MDAPQFPDADASPPQPGGRAPGQASAFRRALDAQAAPPDPSLALVPTGPHDLTAPIDVDALREALMLQDAAEGAMPGGTAGATGPSGPSAPTAPWYIGPAGAATAQAVASTGLMPIPPAPAVPPSPNGPTVVMPSVSVPALRAPTTLAAGPSDAQIAGQFAGQVEGRPDPTVPFPQARHQQQPEQPAQYPVQQPTTMLPAAVPAHDVQPTQPGGAGAPPQSTERSPRHDGGAGKPSRLSTAIGVSALLAAFAGAALVLIDTGHSNAPLAPTALPTKSPSHHAAAAPSTHPASPPPSPSPSHSPSPSPSPSHTPSASPSPSRSAAPTSSPLSPALAGFQTIHWTSQPDQTVMDIQSRLARLHYLTLDRHDGFRFADTQRTASHLGGWNPDPDQAGEYQNATESAIRAFRYDYIQHGQGQFPPAQGCDAATYQALINATS